MLNIRLANFLEQLINTLSCKSGYEYNRCVLHIGKPLTHTVGEVFHCIGFLLDTVPFVDSYNARLALLVSIACNFSILLRYTFIRIKHNNADITSVNSRKRPDNTVTLNNLVNLTAFSHTCCINQYKLLSVTLIFCIYGITCCTCNR